MPELVPGSKRRVGRKTVAGFSSQYTTRDMQALRDYRRAMERLPESQRLKRRELMLDVRRMIALAMRYV
jgi:hypothetical protein